MKISSVRNAVPSLIATSPRALNSSIVADFLARAPATRYYGSKRKLLAWIFEVTSNIKFDTVLDLFGGTASVSLLFKAMSKRVTYHDGLAFNADVAHTLLSNEPALDESWIIDFLERLRPCDGVVSSNFDNIFYIAEENRWIDGYMVAQAAKTLGEHERRLLRYLLYQACLKKRPFNLFHRANLNIRTRTDVKRSFGNLTTWNKSFDHHIVASLKELRKALVTSPVPFEVLPAANAEDVATGFDLVYMDPPYVGHNHAHNRDNYWMKYHFLEGLSRYESWEKSISSSSKIKHLEEPVWMRDWSDKRLFKDLLFSTVLRHKNSIVVLSYVAGAVPSFEEIEGHFKNTFSKVLTFHQAHRYALSGKDKNEILFVGYP